MKDSAKELERISSTKGETGPPKAIINFKFIPSNYQQNSNNYFENSLGETANLQMKGIPTLQVLRTPSPAPYKKKKGNQHIKNDKIKDEHINKYRKLTRKKGSTTNTPQSNVRRDIQPEDSRKRRHPRQPNLRVEEPRRTRVEKRKPPLPAGRRILRKSPRNSPSNHQQRQTEENQTRRRK